MKDALFCLFATVGLAAYSAFALAIPPQNFVGVPEPGTMTLLASGAVAAAVAHRWRRRK